MKIYHLKKKKKKKFEKFISEINGIKEIISTFESDECVSLNILQELILLFRVN